MENGGAFVFAFACGGATGCCRVSGRGCRLKEKILRLKMSVTWMGPSPLGDDVSAYDMRDGRHAIQIIEEARREEF